MINYECYQCFKQNTEQNTTLIYNDDEQTLIPLCTECYKKNKQQTTEEDEQE